MSVLRELERKITSGEMEAPTSSSSSVDDDEDESPGELFGCQWGTCEMVLTRGTIERKVRQNSFSFNALILQD